MYATVCVVLIVLYYTTTITTTTIVRCSMHIYKLRYYTAICHYNSALYCIKLNGHLVLNRLCGSSPFNELNAPRCAHSGSSTSDAPPKATRARPSMVLQSHLPLVLTRTKRRAKSPAPSMWPPRACSTLRACQMQQLPRHKRARATHAVLAVEALN